MFTDHKLSKVSKKDMVAGCIYLTKDIENVLYLGKEDYYEFKYDYEHSESVKKHVNTGKKHIFVYVDGDKRGTFWTQTGFTKIAVSKNIKTQKEIKREAINKLIEQCETMKKDGTILNYYMMGDTMFLRYNEPANVIKLKLKIDSQGGRIIND